MRKEFVIKFACIELWALLDALLLKALAMVLNRRLDFP
jgi:hypothetical protein